MENQIIIQKVAKVMAVSFLEDPMNMAQLEGIRSPCKLMKTHSLLHTRPAVKSKSLNILGNEPGAFLIGYDSKDLKPFREKLFKARIILSSLFCLSFGDLRKLMANMRKNGKVICFDWHREFISGRHYRIKIIAIDKHLRGNGSFRKLITPAIEYAEGNKMPVVLETHNPDNIGLYEHFGFQLVKTLRSNHTNVEQYCMIRPAELTG